MPIPRRVLRWRARQRPGSLMSRKTFRRLARGGRQALAGYAYWRTVMARYRDRHNPGAGWHTRKADEARETGARFPIGEDRAYYVGKRTAHEDSVKMSQRLGLNPRQVAHHVRRNPMRRSTKIFGMTPLVAIAVGWVAYRWWMNQPIIPTFATAAGPAPLSGFNAFPTGLGAFPAGAGAVVKDRLPFGRG